jgi:FixJ family two-component response regulator
MPSVISIIDDDASVRTATNNLLSSHGYLIQTFVSADDFLQSARLDSLSCVIADVQMPGMSGLDLLTHMRAKGYTVPFIFITAFAGPALIDCIQTALNPHCGVGK